ncbi:MAG: hypothetical protein JXR36_12700 [Bacteroidales bacterium]|nr:hypothetical protein [Bacteroidales bacterium]
MKKNFILILMAIAVLVSVQILMSSCDDETETTDSTDPQIVSAYFFEGGQEYTGGYYSSDTMTIIANLYDETGLDKFDVYLVLSSLGCNPEFISMTSDDFNTEETVVVEDDSQGKYTKSFNEGVTSAKIEIKIKANDCQASDNVTLAVTDGSENTANKTLAYTAISRLEISKDVVLSFNQNSMVNGIFDFETGEVGTSGDLVYMAWSLGHMIGAPEASWVRTVQYALFTNSYGLGNVDIAKYSGTVDFNSSSAMETACESLNVTTDYIDGNQENGNGVAGLIVGDVLSFSNNVYKGFLQVKSIDQSTNDMTIDIATYYHQ